MQYPHILYPDVVKSPKKNKVSPCIPYLNIKLNETNFKTFSIQR